MNGSQHICFTDSAGKALFSIPDNGLLCLLPLFLCSAIKRVAAIERPLFLKINWN